MRRTDHKATTLQDVIDARSEIVARHHAAMEKETARINSETNAEMLALQKECATTATGHVFGPAIAGFRYCIACTAPKAQEAEAKPERSAAVEASSRLQ